MSWKHHVFSSVSYLDHIDVGVGRRKKLKRTSSVVRQRCILRYWSLLETHLRAMDYTAPGFDPNALRVVDLKRVLGENNISWPSRHRKSDLVEIFTYELIPKLKREKREKEKRRREKEEKKKKQEEQEETGHEKENKEKTSLSTEERKPLGVLAIKKRDRVPRAGIGKKRKRSELIATNEFQNGDDTALYDGYSDILQRKVKRKRNFSKPNGKSKKAEKDQQKEEEMDRKVVFTSHTSAVKSEAESQENDRQLKNTNLFNRNGEIKFALPEATSPEVKESANIDQIANSTFCNQPDTTANSGDDDGNKEDMVVVNKQPQTSVLSPIKVKLEDNILSGPVKHISLPETKEEQRQISKNLESDIKVKLEQIETLQTEIRDELKSAVEEEKGSALSSSSDIELLNRLPSHNSSNSLTFESDSELLTQLQNEFELENSRIEIESEKVLKMINSKEIFKYYKSQFIKIMVVWITLLLFSFLLAIYRQERIQVGFCGCRTGGHDSLLFKLFNFSLKCVECPEHAVCYPNSEISCLPEYLLSRPLFWSLWGLIPTYNVCVLNSTKVKKINKIVKSVLDLLSRRNANIKCGDGTDEEAALNWKQIVESIDQRLANDSNDKNYAYIWDKVKVMLTTRTDLKFIIDDETQQVWIRSSSLSKLSIKCRLKKLFITILIKYKMYLFSVLTILLILSWIFHQINQVMSRNEYYMTMVREIINKLQQQANETKRTGTGKPYIAKIQLRDYYLPQLHKLSRKNRAALWKRVVKNIEANSNIKTEDLEVNGDIMRVWSWCSDI